MVGSVLTQSSLTLHSHSDQHGLSPYIRIPMVVSKMFTLRLFTRNRSTWLAGYNSKNNVVDSCAPVEPATFQQPLTTTPQLPIPPPPTCHPLTSPPPVLYISTTGCDTVRRKISGGGVVVADRWVLGRDAARVVQMKGS
jgi:hypothetical protein